MKFDPRSLTALDFTMCWPPTISTRSCVAAALSDFLPWRAVHLRFFIMGSKVNGPELRLGLGSGFMVQGLVPGLVRYGLDCGFATRFKVMVQVRCWVQDLGSRLDLRRFRFVFNG